MTTSRNRRTESRPFPPEAWPKGQICYSIVLSFPSPAKGAISREELATAVRALGFVSSGTRFGISIIIGSVKDVVDAGVAREIRERDEKTLAAVQRVPIRRPTPAPIPELDEAANG